MKYFIALIVSCFFLIGCGQVATGPEQQPVPVQDSEQSSLPEPMPDLVEPELAVPEPVIELEEGGIAMAAGEALEPEFEPYTEPEQPAEIPALDDNEAIEKEIATKIALVTPDESEDKEENKLHYDPAAIAQDAVDAGEFYASVKFLDLNVTAGEMPALTANYHDKVTGWRSGTNQFRCFGNDGAELYVEVPEFQRWRDTGESFENFILWVKTSSAEPVTGTMYLPSHVHNAVPLKVTFTIEGGFKQTEGARRGFYAAKAAHYGELQSKAIPGTAWYRHQHDAAFVIATKDDPEKKEDEPDQFGGMRVRRRGFRRNNDLEDTFDLFSGGRAVSENLRLDRQLNVTAVEGATEDINAITGITTTEIDWKELVKGLDPERDPLAVFIPADQHVIFMPTFDDMLQIMDEADANGTPVLNLFETRSEDAGTRGKYKTQICLKTDIMSRIFGGQVIQSVAFTGSDPYLRTGSDIAVLFETEGPAELAAVIKGKQDKGMAAYSGTKRIDLTVKGQAVTGVVSPDRAVCSYLMVLDKAVIVANSVGQLEKIADAQSGAAPALATLDEYTFFRDRYKVGADDEKAFLMLSDAAIRRWGSPRWRIGASRRTVAAAAMSELQARNAALIAAGKVSGEVLAEVPASLGTAMLAKDGINSSVYGNLAFLTPIIELEIDKVTPAEKRAYERFRDRYEEDWTTVFDPIGIRFSLSDKQIAADVTVRPLIGDSDYREFMRFIGEAKIKPMDGDPHPESLAHYIIGMDPNSPQLKELGGLAMQIAPGLGLNALAWLGDWISVYVDESVFWEELKAAIEQGEGMAEDFMRTNYYRFPIAIHVDVNDGLGLTGFLVSLRTFIQSSAPGMVSWQNLLHNGRAYVKIGTTEQSAGMVGQEAAIYYAPSADGLLITPSDELMKRALDRQLAAKTKVKNLCFWLGDSMAVTLDTRLVKIYKELAIKEMASALQERSWANVPILNEWRSQFPGQDPLEIHTMLWKTYLTCPGGGEYVWNEEMQTYGSTVFGYPYSDTKVTDLDLPLFDLTSAELGVTFEEEGLRARARLNKE